MRILKKLLLGVTVLIALLWGGLAAWAYWPGAAEQPVAALARAEDRFVDVDGLQLRYRSWGAAAPDRPALLLIHGFGNSLQSFRELAPRLADCCHVIAIDLPGYGLSSKPVDHDYHNGPQAAVMVRAARALGLARVVYVGHSLGGAIALQAAVQDPQARGLVLLNPGIVTTGVPKIVQVTLPPLPRLSAKMFASREFRADFLRKSYVDPGIVTEAVIDDVMLAARSEGYMAGMTSLMQQYEEGAEIALAARVRVPVLIPWGNQDRNKPASEADTLQRLLPGSKLVRFDNAGHYVHEEQPDGVATAIKAWLATLPATAAATMPAVPGSPGEALPMRTDNSRRSSNIEDRRGMTPARGGTGVKLGIGGTLLALAAAWFLGIDPRMLMGAMQAAQQLPGADATAPAQQVAAGTPQDAAGDWMAAVLGDTEDTWGQIFASGGAQYVPPTLVLFDDAVNSGCGSATAGAGPFYCPRDQKIYIDLDFYRELETQFQAPGDFARAYVLAHEVGHHVQTILGTSQQVREAQARSSETRRNQLQVMMELQADCYAGIWAHHANRSRQILESGDVDEALGAAAAVGDDTIQRRVQGQVVPESFTHGSAMQRAEWFRRGLDSGSMQACDTFARSPGA